MTDRYLAIPISLIREKSLTSMEIFTLIEINQLSMLDKGCVASNTHFAELFDIKKEAVSRIINSLVAKGFINTKTKSGSRNFGRIITVNKMLFDHKQNVISPLTNCLETKENKTNNKTMNNNSETKENENLNKEAFKLWCEYKGKAYSAQGKTLSRNKLLKYPKEIQMQMVENSIMNNYKGLFEIKATTSFKGKEPEYGSIAWRMQQDKNTVDAEVINVSA